MSKRANGEGSIHLRKDGRYAASLSIGHGKRKHFLGRSRAEVAVKLTAALAEQSKGIPVVSNNVNVAKYLNDWLVSVKSSVRPKTYEAYDLNVRRLTPILGRQRLSSLTPAAIERAYGELRDSGLSDRTVLQVHTVLHNALKKAVRWGLLGRNPADVVSPPRPERHEMTTLNQEQVKTLFELTAGDDLHALWVLLTTTGLRIGEALGLKWDDIDFEEQRLAIKRALQRQKGAGLVLVEPKTSRSRRTVYFPDGVGEALKSHRIKQLEGRVRLGAAWQDHGLVFCRADGSPIDPGDMSHRLHRILEGSSLPQIRVHDLRHTAASLQLALGAEPQGRSGDAGPLNNRCDYGHLLPRHTDLAGCSRGQDAGAVQLVHNWRVLEGIRIRPYEQADQAGIEWLYARTPPAGRTYVRPQPLADDLENIQQNYLAFWVAIEPTVDGDALIGLLGVTAAAAPFGITEPDFIDASKALARVHWILVVPERQRMGVGRRLMQTAVDWSKANGCSRLVLETTSEQGAALDFYLKFGFREAGRTIYQRWEQVWFELEI